MEIDYSKMLGMKATIMAGKPRLTRHDGDRVVEYLYTLIQNNEINTKEFYHLLEYVVYEIFTIC